MRDTVYKIITKRSEVKSLIAYCKTTGYASVDFETNALPSYSSAGYPTILGVSFQPGSAYIIPLGHFDSPFKDCYVEILQEFGREILSNPNIIKIAWNIQFEMGWFRKYGIKLEGRIYDGMLAKYLLDEERPNDLKSMVRRYLPEFGDYEESYEGSNLPWDQKPLEGLSKYCAADCDYTFRLMVFFEQKLIDNGFYYLFRNMLMMGTRVLHDSTWRGMDIDREYLESLVEKYENKIADLDKGLRSHRKIRKFEKYQLRTRVDKLCLTLEEQINKLQIEINEIDDPKVIKRRTKAIDTRLSRIDRLRAKDFRTKAELKLTQPINFSSPAQMADLFFSGRAFKFKIVSYTIDKKTKKESNNPSTDESVLQELSLIDSSGFCKILLEYRGATKIYSTYVKGMMEKLSEDSRIHGSFLLHGTVTGRLSSRNPNLQNIPRGSTAGDIKQMFIPPPGYLIMQLDYSQAELRVLAAEAGEKTMIEWFKTGKDIHLASACKKFNENYDKIIKIYKDENHKERKMWDIRRKQAKTINFGIVYGQTANKLAEGLSDHHSGIVVTKEQAQKFLDDFNRDFPMVAKHIAKQHKKVQRVGYVENVFGRKRRLPNAKLPMRNHQEKNNNWGKWAEALRQSVNAPVQGAASDYTLFSSIIIWEQIQSGKLPKDMIQVATVHDSLIFYINPKDIHDVVPKLYEICRNPETSEWFGFQIDDVEMATDFEIGTNWGTLENYKETVDYTELVN